MRAVNFERYIFMNIHQVLRAFSTSRITIIITFLALAVSCERQQTRILVFSKTADFRHESIADGKLALIELGNKNGFAVDTTEDASVFNEKNLKRYRAVVFLNTTRDVLNPIQQTDFKRFIEAGGGFVGIHAAADTEYEWPWYGKLVGAYFNGHPPGTAEAKIKMTKQFGDSLPTEFSAVDEWYNYKSINPDIEVVYNLDESTYTGGTNGANHPIAWYHEFEGGRAFYTGLGHTREAYHNPVFLKLVLSGIQYAVGQKSLNYNNVKSPRMPEENRFAKVVLDFNLDEPTEMAVLPNGDILFLERKGNVKYYDQKLGKTEVIARIPVTTKYNPNAQGEQGEAEDGLLGLALDPNFKSTRWVYMFYSPAGDDPKNSLVRYTLNGKTLDESSKKVILEIPVQRDECCHTGGSIAFDADGNLFLSTGDNTSPFASDGYSPADERPGRAPFDAQKSSGNTNDLRGKILRIHPERDGSYTIPNGNLFPEGEPLTRPEIYVMGNRNPYRISIDKRTGYLYWGEVGPDAGSNDSLRGPRGYDELNQAKKAGYFGWPYFVGKNYPYAKYDFATGKVGPKADPNQPINESPNNTGKRELPPVAPPFIWYPYATSDEFPMVKEGGRNAMAGPVYYSDDFKGISTAFPRYLDGKLLIYDWMRNWMFLVSMDQNGAIMDIEPFMPNTKFNNIMDLAYGPDGKLYMLEYGTQWFKQNFDARLIRIDYNGGNRWPIAMMTANKTNGEVPLTVEIDSHGTSDPDSDELTIELVVDGKSYSSKDGKFTVVFDKPGVYTPELHVRDENGAETVGRVEIIAGNESPKVLISIADGNKTFYFPGTPVTYVVSVNDREDGSTENGKIKSDSVNVTFNFVKGYDMVQIAQGHQKTSVEMPGKALIDNSDCKSCHMISQKSAGPAYLQLADKYRDQKDAVSKLADKVIRGGAGVWGTTEMAAHPQISKEDAQKMVEYILSLGKKKAPSLPLEGSVLPGNEQEGAYVITASYADNGTANTPRISEMASIALRSPVLKAEQAVSIPGALLAVKHNATASFERIDLTAVKSVYANVIIGATQQSGEIELRLDKPNGELIGTIKPNSTAKIRETKGVHTLYLVFKNERAGDKDLFSFTELRLRNQ
jgi:cytochrome c